MTQSPRQAEPRHQHRVLSRLAGFLLLGATLGTSACHQATSAREPALPAGIRIIGSAGRQPGFFTKPRAVAVTRKNELLVLDRSGRCQTFDLNTGKYLRHFYFPEFAAGTPTGITVDPTDDSFWVADTHYQRVLHYSNDGNLIARWGKDGVGPGEMIFPTDASPDPDGKTVWVCEYGRRSRIMQYTRDGQFVREWGSDEKEFDALSRPMGLAVDRDGLLFVADAGNHRLCVFSREGKLLRTIGEPGERPGQLSYPYDVCIAKDQSVYVLEYGNNRVSHFSHDGAFLGWWGCAGPHAGEMFGPWGACLAPDGELVIADTNNDRLQVLEDPTKAFHPAGQPTS